MVIPRESSRDQLAQLDAEEMDRESLAQRTARLIASDRANPLQAKAPNRMVGFRRTDAMNFVLRRLV